jgi:hypothetical protein
MVGLTALVAFLLVAIMACNGGGGEGEATPTPVAGEVQDQLKRMVLQLEDLPSGVIRAEEFFTTNEESAAESTDREGRLASLKEWGRILCYDVTYQPTPALAGVVGLMLVNSATSLYSSEEGAKASFADAVQTARATLAAGAAGTEGMEAGKMEEVTISPLTDEMLWLRMTAKSAEEAGVEAETFADDMVIFRQGPARAYLRIWWIMDGGRSDFIQQLVEAQARRLKDATP